MEIGTETSAAKNTSSGFFTRIIRVALLPLPDDSGGRSPFELEQSVQQRVQPAPVSAARPAEPDARPQASPTAPQSLASQTIQADPSSAPIALSLSAHTPAPLGSPTGVDSCVFVAPDADPQSANHSCAPVSPAVASSPKAPAAPLRISVRAPRIPAAKSSPFAAAPSTAEQTGVAEPEVRARQTDSRRADASRGELAPTEAARAQRKSTTAAAPRAPEVQAQLAEPHRRERRPTGPVAAERTTPPAQLRIGTVTILSLIHI